MIALANFNDFSQQNNIELIKLIRQISPRPVSKEIKDEEPPTYNHNRSRLNVIWKQTNG